MLSMWLLELSRRVICWNWMEVNMGNIHGKNRKIILKQIQSFSLPTIASHGRKLMSLSDYAVETCASQSCRFG
jgi:hypothetical protein